MSITPVELDYFFYTKRQKEKTELETNEYLVRLINTFIFNSNPHLKSNQRIKDPAKLYKISTELETLQENRTKNLKYTKLSNEDYERVQVMLSKMLATEGVIYDEHLKNTN